MARKKKKKKNDEEGEQGSFKFSLPKEVTRAILIVAATALALVFVLSLLGYAGVMGGYINLGLRLVFGWAVWIFPFMIILMTFYWVRTDEMKYKVVKMGAAILFILVYSALLNLQIAVEEVMTHIQNGQGGGYMGLALSYPLLKVTGFWVSLIILTALGTISLLLLFETKLFQLGRALAWVSKKIGLGSLFSGVGGAVAGKLKRDPDYIEKIDSEEEAYDEDEDSDDEVRERAVSRDVPAPVVSEAPVESTEIAKRTSLISKYRRKVEVPLNLLTKRNEIPSSGDIEKNKEKIREALENFGIEVEMEATSTGPTVTQYTLRPQEGVKLSQITALNNDLALALAAHPIRIEAPIPGKALVGIEVPNAKIATVGIREILQSKKFRTERASNLTLAFGKDVSGKSYISDLGKMPHLMIAGATGSGKSVCINVLMLSLLYQNSPDDLKFIMVDPKRVELTCYNDIPHLLTPVITDVKKTINALKWAVEEMDRRYDTLSVAGARNLEAYNKKTDERMPYIVIVIDELADIMSIAAKEVEALIVRLAQMARAVGIHLVLATQRPSVNVITGLIKANITARVAFAVASQTDSRTILDTAGAEKLLGKGDMLFITADLSKPKRVQGAFVDDKEIKAVVKFLKDAGVPEYLENITESKSSFHMPGATQPVAGVGGNDGNGDDLLDDAREVVVSAGKASASYLQRHLRIGYARAARMLDLLEAEGTIGPAQGAKPREVLTGGQGEDEEPTNEDALQEER